MSFISYQTLRANLCGCPKASQFSVAENSGIFEMGESGLHIKALTDNDNRRKSITILDAILVFCSCGNMTIHYPYNEGLGLSDTCMMTMPTWTWKSRIMWTGWRKNTSLRWTAITGPNGEEEIRTLRNMKEFSFKKFFAVNGRIFFTNLGSAENYQIHREQHAIAAEVFTKLLYCWNYPGFKFGIDNCVNGINAISAKIAEIQVSRIEQCHNILVAAFQELFSLKGISKSSRLKDLRLALEIACAKAHITLPELLAEKPQPEFIKELLAD